MAKETFYFTHDYNARNDDKILELRSIHGVEGYGVFWMIVETMAENSNGGVKATLIGGLSLGYGVAKDRLIAIFQTCLEIGLFYEKDGFYFSKRMSTHKNLRVRLSDAGKAGAEKRWGGDSPPNSLPNAKESKGNKKKDINKYPIANSFNGLPEIKNGAIIELFKITKQTDIFKKDVDGLWEIFKIQNLTGENYYENDDKVYSHFINWSKTQNFNNGTGSWNNKSKLGNKSGGFAILTDALKQS